MNTLRSTKAKPGQTLLHQVLNPSTSPEVVGRSRSWAQPGSTWQPLAQPRQRSPTVRTYDCVRPACTGLLSGLHVLLAPVRSGTTHSQGLSSGFRLGLSNGGHTSASVVYRVGARQYMMHCALAVFGNLKQDFITPSSRISTGQPFIYLTFLLTHGPYLAIPTNQYKLS
jgi:hypothetical protein